MLITHHLEVKNIPRSGTHYQKIDRHTPVPFIKFAIRKQNLRD